MSDNFERAQLVRRARKLRDEISAHFDTIDHWNVNREDHEAAIDPDPDGALRKLANNLDVMLTREAKR